MKAKRILFTTKDQDLQELAEKILDIRTHHPAPESDFFIDELRWGSILVPTHTKKIRVTVLVEEDATKEPTTKEDPKESYSFDFQPPPIEDYTVVAEGNLEDFLLNIRLALKEGFVPHGDMFQTQSLLFIQPMVKCSGNVRVSPKEQSK